MDGSTTFATTVKTAADHVDSRSKGKKLSVQHCQSALFSPQIREWSIPKRLCFCKAARSWSICCAAPKLVWRSDLIPPEDDTREGPEVVSLYCKKQKSKGRAARIVH
jgi:hypothetical protein